MKILSLDVSGFRYITDKETKSYKFSDFTTISGDNEKGKTTIQEAIVWVFTGCNLNGNDKANALLQNKYSKSMFCSINFEDNNNINHILERMTGSKTIISLDGKNIKQDDLNSFIGDKDTFISVFVPGYFESRDTAKTRSFLIDLMPAIDKNDIIEQLPGDYKTKVPMRGTLNIADFLKTTRKEIKDTEMELLTFRGQLEVIEESLKNTKSLELKQFDESKIKALESEKQTLMATKPLVSDDSTLKSELQKIDYETPNVKDTPSLENEIIRLETLYKSKKNEIKELDFKSGDVCNSCGQVISDNFIQKAALLLTESNNKIKEEMDKIIEEGKKIKVEINKIKEYNDNIISEFNENIKVRKTEIQNKINAIAEENKKYQEEFDTNIGKEIEDINNKLSELRDEQQVVVEFNAKINSEIEQVENFKSQKVRILADIGVREGNIDIAKTNINIMTEYSRIKSEMLANNIAKYLDKVTIRLEKFVPSTGEVKECFEILYDDKYDTTCETVLLSTSTKIRKDLEIANMVNTITNLNLPIFIDCAESITHYKELSCDQVFLSKVVIDKELEIS
jgi:hypothetical protein